MNNKITSKILVAYSQCPHKAFLLLCTEEQGIPHEYKQILEQRKESNLNNYLQDLAVGKHSAIEVSSSLVCNLYNESDTVVKTTLKSGNLEAYCDVLTQVKNHSQSGGSDYEPTIVVGTYDISKEQELELLFTGRASALYKPNR